MDNQKSILDEVLSSQDEQLLQNFDPLASVMALLKTVDNRGADIIIKRYSLDGKPARTLEEIGQSYQVTRERIRQIESATIAELQKKQAELEEMVRVILSILQMYGKVMEENHLLNSLLAEREPRTADRNATLFVLDLSDHFKHFPETAETHPAWGTADANLDISKKLAEAFIEILNEQKQPIPHDKVAAHLVKHPIYRQQTEGLSEPAIAANLAVSKKVKRNPFNEWGLSHWSQIAPKGVKDKAYVVLHKAGKPLHFVEIAKRIDDTGFDHKKAHPQTVHNELIKDKRFVLVGRGIYALGEWGYEPGTVADILEKILRQAGKPLERDSLVEQVSKQRIVKKNTILLGLQNKNRFVRLPDGRFSLVDKK